MTTTVDHSFDAKPAVGIVHVLNGSRLLLRLAMRLGSVSFALVALLIWIAPGATWDGDVVLFKLALSVISGLISAAMWQCSLAPTRPTVEVDIAKMEVRVVRRQGNAPAQVMERCAFADLDAVDLYGRNITLWGTGKRLLADITLSDVKAHASLLGALRSVGKLA